MARGDALTYVLERKLDLILVRTIKCEEQSNKRKIKPS